MTKILTGYLKVHPSGLPLFDFFKLVNSLVVERQPIEILEQALMLLRLVETVVAVTAGDEYQ